MKSFGIDPNCLEYLAQDQNKWHEVVKHGTKVCETRRNAATELHRKPRKGRATSATATTIPYFHCLRLFCTQIGLISCVLTDAFLYQMVLIDYNRQRRRKMKVPNPSTQVVCDTRSIFLTEFNRFEFRAFLLLG